MFDFKTEDEVINHAIKIMCNKMEYAAGNSLSSPETVIKFLQLHHVQTPHETFSVIFMNAKNKVIKFKNMFTGTVTHAAVYSRTLAKFCLDFNSSSVILAHHHLTGDVNPSNADKELTKKIIKVLDLIDVKVLDHIILSGEQSFSFAENHMV